MEGGHQTQFSLPLAIKTQTLPHFISLCLSTTESPLIKYQISSRDCDIEFPSQILKPSHLDLEAAQHRRAKSWIQTDLV